MSPVVSKVICLPGDVEERVSGWKQSRLRRAIAESLSPGMVVGEVPTTLPRALSAAQYVSMQKWVMTPAPNGHRQTATLISTM